MLENNASLFGSTMKNQPICLLVKMMGNNTVLVDAKSTSQPLIENLIEEFRTVLSP